MKQIYIINGRAGAGKDEFINAVAKHTSVYNYSSVEPIKEIAKMCGWYGKKDEKSRKFLSDLKKLTTEYNDLCFRRMRWYVSTFISTEAVMFIHIREPEEIARAAREFNAKTIYIKRDVPLITSNSSDANVENYNYDYIIDNNGTLEHLYDVAAAFYRSHIERTE